MASSDQIVFADEMGAGLVFDGTDWNVDLLTVVYDNAASGLAATNPKAALDELAAALGNLVDLRLVSGSYNAATDALDFIIEDGAGGGTSTVSIPAAALVADLVTIVDNGNGTGTITVAGGAPQPFVTGPVVSADANNAAVPGSDGGAFVPTDTFELCDSAGTVRHTLTLQAAV